MPTIKKRNDLFSSPEGQVIREQLQAIMNDQAYNTGPSYSANVSDYPDGKIPFIDKHIRYLIQHPGVDSNQYLSNLRLILKIR